MANISYSEIRYRWETRVLPNHWHTSGEAGARAYLKRYGKNISREKVKAISDYARNEGYSNFADGMIKAFDNPTGKSPAPAPAKFSIVSEEDVSILISSEFSDADKKGYTEYSLIDTTIGYLDSLRPVFKGWTSLASLNAFRELCEFSSSLKVRTFIGKISGVYYLVGLDVFVKNEQEAEAICTLSKFGKFRLSHNFYEKGWTFFYPES